MVGAFASTAVADVIGAPGEEGILTVGAVVTGFGGIAVILTVGVVTGAEVGMVDTGAAAGGAAGFGAEVGRGEDGCAGAAGGGGAGGIRTVPAGDTTGGGALETAGGSGMGAVLGGLDGSSLAVISVALEPADGPAGAGSDGAGGGKAEAGGGTGTGGFGAAGGGAGAGKAGLGLLGEEPVPAGEEGILGEETPPAPRRRLGGRLMRTVSFRSAGLGGAADGGVVSDGPEGGPGGGGGGAGSAIINC